MSVKLAAFKGLNKFLAGGNEKILTADDDLVAVVGEELPSFLEVKIHKATNLYKPTVVSMLKFDPYVCAYLTSRKAGRQQTPTKTFSGVNPVFDHTMSFGYKGEPLLVIQAFDQDRLHNEFIGETPLDLLPIVNTNSRSWTGPVTIYGQKGTVSRGEVWITLQLRGGTPYKPEAPAMHFRETDTFAVMAMTPSTPSPSKLNPFCC